MFKTLLDIFDNDFGLFGILKTFWFFENISKTRPSMEHWAKKFFQKMFPKTCSKHFWTLLGTILGIFGKFENCSTFRKHFEKSTLHGTLGKNFFRKKYPKTCSKHFRKIWERFWAFLVFCNFLIFFKSISKTRPSMEHWAKKFLEKLSQNMFKYVWTLLGTILGIFGKFENCSTFRKHFEDSTLHGTLGKKKIWKKIPQNMFKTCLEIFRIDFGIFGILKNFWFFENISKTRPSMEHWAKKIFRKKYPKTCSKHVWTLLGTILGIFAILKIFWFSENISKTLPSMEHWAKKILEKSTPKHVQNTFGHFWERFWAFWNFENFLIFWKHFEDSTLHGTLGKKIFRKKYPKTCSKHVWTLLGTILGIFGNL